MQTARSSNLIVPLLRIFCYPCRDDFGVIQLKNIEKITKLVGGAVRNGDSVPGVSTCFPHPGSTETMAGNRNFPKFSPQEIDFHCRGPSWSIHFKHPCLGINQKLSKMFLLNITFWPETFFPKLSSYSWFFYYCFKNSHKLPLPSLKLTFLAPENGWLGCGLRISTRC